MVIPIFERWGLNPREQRVASIAVYVLGVFIFLAIPVGLSLLVSSRKADNDELREALTSVNGARGKIQERRTKRNQIIARYENKAPPLAGFLEQTASANKLQVSDSVDRPEVPHGKRYVERNTVIHLKKAGLLPIAMFLEAIEKSGHPVSVSRLNLRKRSGEPDSYDVEVGVSAFDRTDITPKPAAPTPESDDGEKDDN